MKNHVEMCTFLHAFVIKLAEILDGGNIENDMDISYEFDRQVVKLYSRSNYPLLC